MNRGMDEADILKSVHAELSPLCDDFCSKWNTCASNATRLLNHAAHAQPSSQSREAAKRR
jgi:hypothetical protein